MMLFAVMATMLAGLTPAQAAADRGPEAQSIREAVLDYAEGYYERAPDRMTRAVSPLLTKRALVTRPGVPSFLSQMNAEMLIEATRGGPRPPAAERRLTVEVLDVSGDLASARVFSVLFNDYVHLIRRDGRWQLVSVLWHTPPAPAVNDPSAAAAVERAARDYAGALASKDRQRVLDLLSPVAAIRSLVSAPSGARVLRDQNAEGVAAAAAAGQMPPGNPSPDVIVLGTDGDIASAKLGGGAEVIYLHLALQADRWRVINTLNAASAR
ncbi:MAG: nuclear transport factor 2 family protein [Vicinamibacteria bacterium]|nr:nuclear transport factor 2 family protein [Vicinamibacteria bacterium]